jgi:phage gp46-like protein
VTDILTRHDAGQNGFGFDWGIEKGALSADDGLTSAVIISLFSDRVAAADDQLPDGSGDRRGCWSDMPLDDGKPDPIGSRLWLLARAKATVKTAARAQQYALEALQWLKDDGVAGDIEVTAQYVTAEQLRLTVNITRQVAGQPVNHRFDYVWNPSKPVPFVLTLPTLLTDEGGTPLMTEDGTLISLF